MELPSPEGNVDWLRVWRRYLSFATLTNLVWELAHLPLYTIWTEALWPERLFAAVHCTLGDVLIATDSLVLSLAVVGDSRWPRDSFCRVALMATVLGIAYTIFSEWLNLVVRQSWAYSAWMPTLPMLGTGLSPLLQWLVLPPLGLAWARGKPARYTLKARTGA